MHYWQGDFDGNTCVPAGSPVSHELGPCSTTLTFPVRANMLCTGPLPRRTEPGDARFESHACALTTPSDLLEVKIPNIPALHVYSRVMIGLSTRLPANAATGYNASTERLRQFNLIKVTATSQVLDVHSRLTSLFLAY